MLPVAIMEVRTSPHHQLATLAGREVGEEAVSHEATISGAVILLCTCIKKFYPNACPKFRLHSDTKFLWKQVINSENLPIKPEIFSKQEVR